MNDEQINHAIDREVREMLDLEPPSDLRARVIARIDRPASRFGWVPVASALAVAALVIIGIGVLLIPRHARPAEIMSGRVEPPSVAVPNATTPPVAAGHQRPSTTEARIEPSRPERASSGRIAVAANTDADQAADALDPIAPIRIAAAPPADIAPQPIVIEPLAPITELKIAPLTPSDGRH